MLRCSLSTRLKLIRVTFIDSKLFEFTLGSLECRFFRFKERALFFIIILDMVASGVPRRNGERHAIAIADMSLDLVSVSHSFVIPHKPDEPLKIRVGLHSGR